MAELKAEEQPLRARTREIAKRIFRHENAVLAIILVVIVAALAGMTKGITASRDNVYNVLLQSSSRGLASIGQTFVILTAGIDVSVGGMALLAANLGAGLMTATQRGSIAGGHFPVAAGILIMLLAGIGMGAGNGFFVSRVRVPALIATLAVWRMTYGGAYQVGKGYTIADMPRSLAFIGQGNIAGVPSSVILFIAVAAVAYFVLYHTTFGRSVYAVGGNPLSAWLSGVKVKNVIFCAYAISGLLAALAAVVTISRTLTASMATLTGLELDSIAAVCIGGVSLAGGRGTLIGAIIGVIILGVISNGMNILGVGPAFQDLIKGAIILSAVSVDVVRRR